MGPPDYKILSYYRLHRPSGIVSASNPSVLASDPLRAVSDTAPRAGRFEPGRDRSLSAHIVSEVRDALFGKRLSSGDFLGTENDLAARFGVSRMAARDALRTLQALGVVEIRPGKGGGARIAHGNPALFAEALAVQLELTGVTAAEIVDAQRAIECLAAELAATEATPAEHARLRELLSDARRTIKDAAAYTRSCRDFHLAIAECSHNRVLAVQLVSLQHVPWPAENRTLTSKVAWRVLEAHERLLALLERRDPAGARALMNEHVLMIRARRTAERDAVTHRGLACC